MAKLGGVWFGGFGQAQWGIQWRGTLKGGNPKSLKVAAERKAGSEGVKRRITGELEGETTEQRVSNKGQKEAPGPAENREGTAKQTHSDDERRGTNREPAGRLVGQTPTNEDVGRRRFSKEVKRATAAKTDNDGGRQRSNIKDTQTEAGSALEERRTERIRAMSLQGVTERGKWVACRRRILSFRS